MTTAPTHSHILLIAAYRRRDPPTGGSACALRRSAAPGCRQVGPGRLSRPGHRSSSSRSRKSALHPCPVCPSRGGTVPPAIVFKLPGRPGGVVRPAVAGIEPVTFVPVHHTRLSELNQVARWAVLPTARRARLPAALVLLTVSIFTDCACGGGASRCRPGPRTPAWPARESPAHRCCCRPSPRRPGLRTCPGRC